MRPRWLIDAAGPRRKMISPREMFQQMTTRSQAGCVQFAPSSDTSEKHRKKERAQQIQRFKSRKRAPGKHRLDEFNSIARGKTLSKTAAAGAHTKYVKAEPHGPAPAQFPFQKNHLEAQNVLQVMTSTSVKAARLLVPQHTRGGGEIGRRRGAIEASANPMYEPEGDKGRLRRCRWS